MIIGEITTANAKGQIVIPKKIRKELGIATGTAFKIVQNGKNINLVPIKALITASDEEDSYVKILEATTGSWGKISAPSKKDIEIKASKKRRRLW